MEPFSLNPVPAIRFGAGVARALAGHLTGIPSPRVVIVADRALADLGILSPITGALKDAGLTIATYSDVAGEPKERQVDEVTALIRAEPTGAVVCIGGGSALDIGKPAAAIAAAEGCAADYALAANPFPARTARMICIPTTAGTGSELSATAIFSNAAGKKLWFWGQEIKPDLVLLDPELTVSLPPNLTAWTGCDAFTHALEACTNRNRTPGNDFYAHKALSLITGALEKAVADGSDLDARGAMLLGSAYAGIAIDNCGTAVAHNIGHALAGLAPVHHGLATLIGLEESLAWCVAADTGPFDAAARACGWASANELPDRYSEWLDRCGIHRRLPEIFAGIDATTLATEMRRDENAPMRAATARDVTDGDIDMLAARVMMRV